MSLHKFGQKQKLNAKRRQMLKLLGLSVVGLAAPGIAGCAFQPLYGPTASGAQMSDVLKSVNISPIPGRVGQRVRNELIYQVTNGGAPLDARYRLDVVLRESEIATLVESSGDSQGQIYLLDADFKLIRLKDKKPVFKGKSHSRAPYDKSFYVKTTDASGNEVKEQVNSTFGNIRARIDAENRASRVMAEEIKTRIAAYLSSEA
jgi:LPS-assembly lipoprotein